MLFILLHHFSFLDFLTILNSYADTIGLIIILILFFKERKYAKESRKKDSFIAWYLDFVIGKNISYLDEFFTIIEDELIVSIVDDSGSLEGDDAIFGIKMSYISRFDRIRNKVNNNFFILISSLDSDLYNTCLNELNEVEDQVKLYIDLKIGTNSSIDFDFEKLFMNKSKIYEHLFKPIQKLDI